LIIFDLFRFKHVKHKVGVQVKKKKYYCEKNLKGFVFLEKSNIPHFETSAKEGINVEKAFETVARNALAREKDIDPTPDFPQPIRIPDRNQPTPSNKCSC
jgi:hypothetical protein